MATDTLSGPGLYRCPPINSDFAHPQQSKQLFRQGGKKQQAEVGSGEHHTSTAPFSPLPKAALRTLHILPFILTLSPASRKCWPCFSQESCEKGWGSEVRGLPPDTQQEGQGWGVGELGVGWGVELKALLVELWPPCDPSTLAPPPQPPGLTTALTRPFSTHATRNTAPPVSAFKASGSSRHSRAQHPRPPGLPDPDPC